jgi:hypothetical protein
MKQKKQKPNYDRAFAIITGLALSAVSAYYAVTGLAMIFAGAFIQIIIMGAILEVGKIITASYLYRNWRAMPVLMRGYFTAAVVILMMITSMGVFGYLSRAHIDQVAPVGDTTAKIERIDQNLSRERQRIERSETVINQLDEAIDRMISLDRATQALQARKTQAAEREAIRKEISEAQANIDKLLDEKLPLTQKIRETQTEVGPIRFVAELIYGESSNEVLEKAVRVMIIALVLVLDPLALLLIISANLNFYYAPNSKQNTQNNKYSGGTAKQWLKENSNAVATDGKEWHSMEAVVMKREK